MERFNTFKPEVNDWILRSTETESQNRRERERKLDKYIFIERLAGQVFGLIMGIGGIVSGSIVTVYGYPATGATIAGVAIGTLAVAFIGGRLKGN